MTYDLIETHAHIYDSVFAEDRSQMLEKAFETGVSQIWMPNCNSETIPGMMELASNYPQQCLPMMGLHPCYVKDDVERELYVVEEWLAKYPFLAIGEIGMDLYWDKSFVAQQEEAFLVQCQLAKKHNLWIDIHSRDAFWEVVALIEKNADPNLKGIFHCFSGGLNEAKKAIELGFLLGIGGVVTFKNATQIQASAQIVPADRLLIETDCPFLAPVPKRGKRNEPAFVSHVASYLAQLRGDSLESLATFTTTNAQQLFKLPMPPNVS